MPEFTASPQEGLAVGYPMTNTLLGHYRHAVVPVARDANTRRSQSFTTKQRGSLIEQLPD